MLQADDKWRYWCLFNSYVCVLIINFNVYSILLLILLCDSAEACR